MDADQLRSERIRNLIDATSFKEPDKIPVGAEILSWPFAYANMKYADIMDDPQKVFENYVKFTEIMDLDFLFGGFVSVPIRAYEAVGCKNFAIGDDGVCFIHLQPSIKYMAPEDYPDLIADPVAFGETIVRRQCEAFLLPKEEAYEKIIQGAKALKPWMEANDLIKGHLFGEKAIVPIPGDSHILFLSGITSLFDRYRGMRDTLLDIRKRPELLRQACDALLGQMRKRLSRVDPNSIEGAYPFGTSVYHAECFLSPAQFDEFFFEPFKEMCLPLMEAGLKFFIKGEGSFINTLDRYRQFPKGSIIFMLDEDDPFEVHKAIGDWQTIATGITADLLQMGEKEQCVDFVKRSFDTFAPGGGFIFMQNKPLLCAADAKIENLEAVYKTANELSRQ
jgi:hypothetical protein